MLRSDETGFQTERMILIYKVSLLQMILSPALNCIPYVIKLSELIANPKINDWTFFILFVNRETCWNRRVTWRHIGRCRSLMIVVASCALPWQEIGLLCWNDSQQSSCYLLCSLLLTFKDNMKPDVDQRRGRQVRVLKTWWFNLLAGCAWCTVKMLLFSYGIWMDLMTISV